MDQPCLPDAPSSLPLRSSLPYPPGAIPYLSQRPMSVAGRYDAWSLLEFLLHRHPHVPKQRWLDAIHQGRMYIDGQVVSDPKAMVRAGNRLLHHEGYVVEPAVDLKLEVVYEDHAFLVINKGAPLPVHPCGRFNHNTVVGLLARLNPSIRYRPVHRLDADTTGLLVLAKSTAAARTMGHLFESHSIAKTYLARVAGAMPLHASGHSIPIHTPLQKKPAPLGKRKVGQSEQDWMATTHITALQHVPAIDSQNHGCEQETLLMVQPTTGRTHQIRIHLAHMGHPIVNDVHYMQDDALGSNRPKPKALSQGPIALHAFRLEQKEPNTVWQTPLPAWFPVSRMEI